MRAEPRLTLDAAKCSSALFILNLVRGLSRGASCRLSHLFGRLDHDVDPQPGAS